MVIMLIHQQRCVKHVFPPVPLVQILHLVHHVPKAHFYQEIHLYAKPHALPDFMEMQELEHVEHVLLVAGHALVQLLTNANHV